jgi:type III restriction enzyme
MRIELKEFQENAVADLFGKIKKARRDAMEDGEMQAIVLSSPTGSGKTITLTALIERILRGDESEMGDRDAVFLWLSDSPELNEQSRDKLLKTSSIFRPHDLPVIDATFDQERFTPGKVYFLNTQKIGKDKLLVTKGDRRTYTLWETIRNTEATPTLRFYVVIDEAHRGTAEDSRDRTTAASIVQKFIKGSEGEIPPIKLIIGMSATPEKFLNILDARRTKREVVIDPADVRASGLLKDSIVIRHPAESQPSDWSLLHAATAKWRAFGEEWRRYTTTEKLETSVKPVFVVQVENGNEKRLTNTDLEKTLETIESITGRLDEGDIVHCFQEDTSVEIRGYTIRKADASKIQDDDRIRIVLFKASLTTGWDCPRAEVMMSFRRASDPTNIAQLVGRMVRTPLARRIETSEALNSVSLYLPYYDEAALDAIINRLSKPDAEEGIGVEVSKESEVAEYSKDASKAELFDALAELPSYSIERIPKASNVARLIKLARQLNLDGIDKDAWGEAKALAVKTLMSEGKRLGKNKAFAKAINEKKEISVRAVTFDYNKLSADDGRAETIPATDENIENLFDLCAKQLGEGLHMEYWRANVDMNDPLRAKLTLYLILQDDQARRNLEAACGERLKQLFDKYNRDTRKLPVSAQEKYRKIRRQAKDPEPLTLIYPDTIQLPKGKTDWRDHLYTDANGDFHIDFKSGWETIVLKEEISRKDFAGWLRNVDRKPWALTIPYEMDNETKAAYPDFIILRRVGKRTIVDLLEPHDTTRTDAVYKAKGFARYAEKHGEFYGRIELIEVVKGKTKRLNIADEMVREKVKRISNSEDLHSLFENL